MARQGDSQKRRRRKRNTSLEKGSGRGRGGNAPLGGRTEGCLCGWRVLACKVDLGLSWPFAEKEDFERPGRNAPFLQRPGPRPPRRGLLLEMITCRSVCWWREML